MCKHMNAYQLQVAIIGIRIFTDWLCDNGRIMHTLQTYIELLIFRNGLFNILSQSYVSGPFRL